MSEHVAYQLSVGRPSPFPSLISDGSRASLVIDAAVPIVVMMMTRPSRSDVSLVGTDRIDVAFSQERQSAILLWRFSCSGKPTMFFDTPLNVGLEIVREFPNLSTRDLAPGEQRSPSRIVQMPQAVSELLAPVLTRQVAHRHLLRQDPRKKVEASVDRYLELHPSPEEDFASAPVKGRAS